MNLFTKSINVKLIFLVLIALLAINCTSTTPTETPEAEPVADESKEKEKIKATLIDMWDAIEKGDMERYASYVHPDFTQWGETAKVLRVGKDAEVKAIKEWVEEPTKVKTEMKEPRVTIRGDTAWITYFWSDSGTTKGEPFATKGKSTRIFVREKGKWLCIHGHYTLLGD